MAVELRCPDCRAKLRLPEAPDAGTEVECPKCGTVFPAPEDATGEDAPKKKKKLARDEDGDERPKKNDDSDEKKEKKKAKTKDAANPNAPRKRKAKKRETSSAALIGVIGAGLLMLTCVTGVLIYFFTRTSKSVEMMYYLPEDTDTVQGLNLGHAQKYPDFYKTLSNSFAGTEFKAAADALAGPLGATDGNALVDYVVCGSSTKGSSATVIRTKTAINGGGLAKLPGAQAQTLDGKTYYVADGFKGGKVRVFSPTDRLIVFCPTDVQEAVFRKMLNGHADSKEKTIGVRSAELGKRVTRGTFWQLELYDGGNKPAAAPTASPSGGQGGAPGAGGGSNDDGAAQFARLKADTLSGSKGVGMKASLGSREVRFEIVVWYPDSEKAANVSKKHQDSELAKGDEGTPPKWWKEKVDGGSKKISAQMLSNVGCGTSGELFYAKSAVESSDLKDGLGTIAGRVTGSTGNSGGPGMPGMPSGGLPMGGPPKGGPPKGPRRRVWARR